jgi:hypothetical protein
LQKSVLAFRLKVSDKIISWCSVQLFYTSAINETDRKIVPARSILSVQLIFYCFAGTDAGALFNGAPTAISQRWPGLPCSGFNPAPVGGGVVAVTGVGGGIESDCDLLTVTGFCCACCGGTMLDAGALFSGAPSGISQR